jgi:hypothetical protein
MNKVFGLILFIFIFSINLFATQPSQDGVNHISASNDQTSFLDHVDSGNLPNATTLGKYLVAHVYMCSTLSGFCSGGASGVYFDSVTDTQSNTYYEACGNGYPIGGPYTERWATWVAKVTTAGTTNVTAHNFAGGFAFGDSIMVYEVDLGVTDVNPTDVCTTNYVGSQVNTNSITSASLGASNEWIDCWFGNGLPSTSFGAPVTLIQSEDGSTPYQRVAGGVAATSSAQTCTINYSGTAGTEMTIAVFKAAAAPSGSVGTRSMLSGMGH